MSDLTPQPSVPPQAPAPQHRLPADYYASSPAEVRPIFPRWVPIGCGWAAAALLLAGFVIGAVIVRNGIGSLMDMVIGSMEGEIAGMYGKDVPAEQKQAFEAEMKRLHANLVSEKVSIVRLDPLITAIRDTTSDHVVTSAELAKLTAAVHQANEPAKPKAASHERPRLRVR